MTNSMSESLEERHKKKANWAKYYENHKEELKAKRKARYEANKNAEQKASLNRRNNNIVKVRINNSIWQKKNRGKINEWRKNKVANDLNFKLSVNLRSNLTKSVSGKIKYYNGIELLGCSVAEFRAYLASKFEGGMSWENYGRGGWHIDHIKPCALFNFTNVEDQKQCFHYSNMQPLWAIDNIKKGKKYAE